MGLDIFYLGWTVNFNPSAAEAISRRMLSDFYAWLTSNPYGIGPILIWVFTIAGICIMIGFFMRTAAFVAIVFAVISFLPNLRAGSLGVATLVNSEVLATIALLVLVFSNAGTYVGLDTFIHIRLFGKRK